MLEARASSLGLGGLVRFRGRMAQREVAESMRQARFLVLPSLWENAPLAAIEALACGLPIVASRVGGIPEIVSERTGLLVTPGDPQALAAAIREMSRRFGEYDAAELGSEARRRFGFEAVAQAWTGVYEDAVALGRS
jgi:glycosyltransferase involved in cell wall biosynthesis